MKTISLIDLLYLSDKAHVLDLVVSEENQKAVANCLPRADFMINYRLDCSNLCSDFKEDISFQFSLGFTALLRRFTGNKSTSLLFQNNATKFMQNFQQQQQQQQQPGNDQLKKEMMSRQLSGSNLNSFALPNNGDQAGNLLVLLQGFQMATSRSNVVLVAVGGIASAKFNETQV